MVAEQMEWVILACGPSLREYLEQIAEYIKPTMITVGTNNLDGLFVPDYHVWVNRRRFRKHREKISPKSKLVLGYKFKDKCDHRLQFDNDYLNDQGFMDIGKTIKCAGATVAALAAGFAIQMGAKRITFAGLDGFSGGKLHHYKEDTIVGMEKLLLLERATHGILRDLNKVAPVKILTPTVYEEYYEGFADSV